jgi:hypothetical protein
VLDASEQILSDAANVIDDENEFILDAQEQDIPRVKAKPTKKSLPKLSGPNRPLPPMVQRSLFSFSALRHSKCRCYKTFFFFVTDTSGNYYCKLSLPDFSGKLSQNLGSHFGAKTI